MVTASRLMGLKKRLFSPRNVSYPLEFFNICSESWHCKTAKNHLKIMYLSLSDFDFRNKIVGCKWGNFYYISRPPYFNCFIFLSGIILALQIFPVKLWEWWKYCDQDPNVVQSRQEEDDIAKVRRFHRLLVLTDFQFCIGSVRIRVTVRLDL